MTNISLTEEQLLQLKRNTEDFNAKVADRKEFEKALEYNKMLKRKEEVNAQRPAKNSYLGYHPSNLVKELDKIVIKQFAAKKELALTLTHSLLRHFDKHVKGNDLKIDKKTLLLTGDTGVGKTLLVKTACEKLNLPLLILDCSSWVAEGWYGKGSHAHFKEFFGTIREIAKDRNDSFESVLATAVVYLDEFDKLSMNLTSDHNKDSHYSKQFNLLKLIEGTSLESDIKGEDIDITDMTFILSGSFHEFTEEKELHRAIGFTAKADEKISEMERHDFFKQAGIITELAGRITTVVNLVNLEIEDYVTILSKKEGSLVEQYKAIFELYDKKLEINKEELLAIAEKAAKLKIGARGLNSVFVEYINEKMYQIDEPDSEVKLLKRSN